MEYVKFSSLMKKIFRLKEFCPEVFTRQPIRRPKPIHELQEYEIYRILKPIHKLQELFPLFREPLSPEEVREINEDIKKWGIEALAWYRPFHYLPIESWGIYITLRGLKYLIGLLSQLDVKNLALLWTMKYKKYRHKNFETVLSELKSISESNTWRLKEYYKITYAFEILWQHELFHFLVELFSLRTEILMLKPKYIPYESEIYIKQYPNCLEEALANRHVLSRRYLRPIYPFIQTFFDRQPGCYNKYRDYLGPNFKRGKEELCNLIVFLSNKGLPIDEIQPPSEFSARTVPTYIVSAKRLPEIPDTLSLIIKVNKLIRFLKRQNCKLVRKHGSHAIFDVRGRKISIPVHGNREVHHKIVKQILEALEITREEFLEKL